MKKTINVKGMSCSHCENAVDTALCSMEGVKSASSDAKTGKVQISYDENKTNLEDILPQIKEAGFDPVTPQYRKISHEEALDILAQSKDYVLLDVRSREEYDEKHIAGAVLLPYNELEKRAEAELPDKDALILVYCRSGARSQSAANILVHLSYTNVYDFGGIIGWKD